MPDIYEAMRAGAETGMRLNQQRQSQFDDAARFGLSAAQMQMQGQHQATQDEFERERMDIARQVQEEKNKENAVRFQGQQEYQSLLDGGALPEEALQRTAHKLYYNNPAAMAAQQRAYEFVKRQKEMDTYRQVKAAADARKQADTAAILQGEDIANHPYADPSIVNSIALRKDRSQSEMDKDNQRKSDLFAKQQADTQKSAKKAQLNAKLYTLKKELNETMLGIRQAKKDGADDKVNELISRKLQLEDSIEKLGMDVQQAQDVSNSQDPTDSGDGEVTGEDATTSALPTPSPPPARTSRFKIISVQ